MTKKLIRHARREFVAYTLLAAAALCLVGTVQERIASPSFATTTHK